MGNTQTLAKLLDRDGRKMRTLCAALSKMIGRPEPLSMSYFYQVRSGHRPLPRHWHKPLAKLLSLSERAIQRAANETLKE